MGLKDTLIKHTDPKVLGASLSRLGVSIGTAFNPDHRHDEECEKEVDRRREAIRDGHRFRSFAPIREGNAVKFYSDGCDYFWALSEILDSAKECIYILDWWLSPELYLRRPPSMFEEWRVDRLLKRKAEEGVKIFVVVYKEVTQTMTMSSAHTKHHLEALHKNIQVARHPDHLGGEVTLFWSHHEKLVCVDNRVACIGGLDICFGRWDTQSHPLADLHPSDWQRTLFPGQDYNNARVQDFQQVDDFMSNQQSRLEIGRMPWHDVHVSFYGPAALDVSMHFIERWNFIKQFKYKHDHHFSWLAFPNGANKPEDVDPLFPDVARHPHLQQFEELGEKFRHPFHSEHRTQALGNASNPIAGSASIQVIRSSADWSLGILTENSIQSAYIEAIREANHCIYIENQFFITATQLGEKVQNVIGSAIVERVLSAAKDGRRFKVIIVIPTIPCFAGELEESAGIRCIMAFQYWSICRSENSIFKTLEKAGVNPHDYISFYNLRGYDRINYDRKMIAEVEYESGISFHETQVAISRVHLSDAQIGDGPAREVVKIRNPVSDSDKVDEKTGQRKPAEIAAIPLPASTEEAKNLLKRFQAKVPQSHQQVRDSIASDILHGQRPERETWNGSAADEKAAYVTEETYVHSKIMIVDDRRVIIGSANLNDRSQCGNRDSEIAVCIEEKDLFESRMDGKPYMASTFAASFRRHLWRQHLGLIPPQGCTPEEARSFPTAAMRPAPYPNPDPSIINDEYDQLVQDPLSEELERMWKGQATTNTEVYDDVFRVVPSDKVRNWKDYHSFFPKPPIMTGHVADLAFDLDWIKQRLSQVRGSLVNMPLHFLEEEDLQKGSRGTEVNDVTLKIYL
ncbi:phospholipase D/nuclease [Tilletiaria anomala UBC 951]|uniref:Phospholipase n=1 Tax=Tilletiaria anomala (strain ATCC 24038 / CBS 436.72 / UBC 951) TaxID=1037660 RepID=A0A066VSB0_TILAU|nr:phospholipase D/nuclease [Tilletiaria anomala UBC 951]KDN41694.1 phospholipase D/nuclease [Tilletiaria anomala UBC 951]